MDKLSKSILSFMTRQPNGTASLCSLSDEWDYACQVSFSALSSAVQASESDTRAAISYLVSEQLVEYSNINAAAGPIAYAFHLSHKGLHFKEFRFLTAKEKWKERLFGFCSGVFISGLSGLIVWLISK